MKTLVALFSILMLFGCANTYKTDYVVDGSTELSTSKSLAQIEKGLSNAERQELMMALLAINLDGVNGYEFLVDVQDNPKLDMSGIGAIIDGLNYYQILELAQTSTTTVTAEVR